MGVASWKGLDRWESQLCSPSGFLRGIWELLDSFSARVTAEMPVSGALCWRARLCVFICISGWGAAVRQIWQSNRSRFCLHSRVHLNIVSVYQLLGSWHKEVVRTVFLSPLHYTVRVSLWNPYLASQISALSKIKPQITLSSSLHWIPREELIGNILSRPQVIAEIVQDRDTEARRTAVHEVARSWTPLSGWTTATNACVDNWKYVEQAICLQSSEIKTMQKEVFRVVSLHPWSLLVVVFHLCPREHVCVLAQSLGHLWLCGPGGWSPPGSSVHGILQGGILEWVAIFSSRGSSQPRDQTHISCIAGGFFTTEPPGKPLSQRENHLNHLPHILHVSLYKYKQMVWPLPFTS